MAFLNTPMAEVWKATKRTFSEFVDVDSTNNRTDRIAEANVSDRIRRNNIEPILKPVSVNTSVTQNVNTRPSGYMPKPENEINTASRRPIDNIGSGTTTRAPSRRTHAKLSHSKSWYALEPSNSPRSQRQRGINLETNSDSKSKAILQTNQNSPPQSFQKLQGSHNVHAKGRNKYLGLLSSGFSPPKSNKSTTRNPSSQDTEGVDNSDIYLQQSQTVPELSFGLYPQYAGCQPREPIITKDQPLSLPELELSEHQGSSSNARSRDGAINNRTSRAIEKNPRLRYRSSSSDRAREMKVFQRRQSFNKTKTLDVNKISDEDDDEDWLEQAEKVKLKFMSMWNNVKYGWTVKTKTPFNIHKAIWLLGKCYHHKPEDPDLVRLHPAAINQVRSPAMEFFKQDFASRIWLTYRREFPQLSGSTLTTDCGWGCMLRSGQMLLAQALIMHFLGRDWNLYKGQTVESDRLHRQIIHWFGDQPSDMSPFSVHQLVDIGKRCGKRAGDWFGPSSVAHIIKEAVDKAPELNPMLDNICIYVSQDCTVYKQDVIDLCTQRRKRSLKPIFFDIVERTSPRNVTGRPAPTERDIVKNNDSTTLKRLDMENTRKHLYDKDLSPGSVGNTDGHIDALNGSDVLHGTSDTRTDTKKEIDEKLCNVDPSPGTSLEESEKFDRLNGEKSIFDDNSFEKVLKSFDSVFDKYSSRDIGYEQPDTAADEDDYRRKISSAGSESSTLGSDWERVSQHGTPPVVGSSPQGAGTSSKTSQGNSQSNRQLDCNDVKVNTGNEENVDPAASQRDRTDRRRKDQGGETGNHGDEGDTMHSNNSHSPTQEYTSEWCAVIVLVPVRLGGEEVNGIYIRPLQSLFSMTNCIGIIGGKPKHSLYFVGFQDEKLIHLDPHYCQQVVDMKEKDFPLWSFHCMSPRKMAVTKMDPSCTIGFYLKTREDFDKFCIEVQQVINPPGNTKDYPMFIIREGRCKDWNAQHESAARSERYLRVRHVNQDGQLVAPVTAAEDFVLLD